MRDLQAAKQRGGKLLNSYSCFIGVKQGVKQQVLKHEVHSVPSGRNVPC